MIDVDTLRGLFSEMDGSAGVGIDVEAVERFVDPDTRIFTLGELEYCAAQSNPAESRAGRWCAKEAVVKACAKHLQLSLREIEIQVEASGRPTVVLPRSARDLGLAAEISITHSQGVAAAIALVLRVE